MGHKFDINKASADGGATLLHYVECQCGWQSAPVATVEQAHTDGAAHALAATLARMRGELLHLRASTTASGSPHVWAIVVAVDCFDTVIARLNSPPEEVCPTCGERLSECPKAQGRI